MGGGRARATRRGSAPRAAGVRRAAGLRGTGTPAIGTTAAVIVSLAVHALALSAYLAALGTTGMSPPELLAVPARPVSNAPWGTAVSLGRTNPGSRVSQVPVEVPPEPARDPAIEVREPADAGTAISSAAGPGGRRPSWNDLALRSFRSVGGAVAREDSAPADAARTAPPALPDVATPGPPEPSTDDADPDRSPPGEHGATSAIAPAPSDGNAAPRYPGVARRRGWEGVVVLAVQVDARGAVRRVSVARGSGHRVLDQAAQHAVESWRFRPATAAGVRVSGEAEVTIRFQLED
jgi:protein TonB